MGHGNKTISVFLTANGLLFVLPTLLSLISDGTVQSETPISFIVCRGINANPIKTTNHLL